MRAAGRSARRPAGPRRRRRQRRCWDVSWVQAPSFPRRRAGRRPGRSICPAHIRGQTLSAGMTGARSARIASSGIPSRSRCRVPRRRSWRPTQTATSLDDSPPVELVMLRRRRGRSPSCASIRRSRGGSHSGQARGPVSAPHPLGASPARTQPRRTSAPARARRDLFQQLNQPLASGPTRRGLRRGFSDSRRSTPGPACSPIWTVQAGPRRERASHHRSRRRTTRQAGRWGLPGRNRSGRAGVTMAARCRRARPLAVRPSCPAGHPPSARPTSPSATRAGGVVPLADPPGTGRARPRAALAPAPGRCR